MNCLKIFLLLVLAALNFIYSQAEKYEADFNDYTNFLSMLSPGDTLLLAPGDYLDRLNIHTLNGTEDQPIIIIGSGNSTIFLGNACCNTVSIKASSFIVLRDIKIDGQGIQYIDAVKAEGNNGNWAHDITLENLTIIGHGANQQTVGIGTKCPVWNWVIRDCVIDGAGTGMYLGNSDGEQPFVNGLIENNLIKNTIGYNMQIKHQNLGSRNVDGMVLNGKTIIRNNVFSKAENASSGGDSRPNILLGNFPESGDGSDDYYEFYGNFIWQNPTESLFQGTGNIAFYDNICINDMGGNGIAIQTHVSFAPRDIRIFHNTIYCEQNWGIRLMDTDVNYQKYIYGNLVLSNHDTPIRIVGSGVETAELFENVVELTSNGNEYLNNATIDLNEMDFFPKENGGLKSSEIPKELFEKFLDYSIDFNGIERNWEYRGAYTGSGQNEGWSLAIEKKPKSKPVFTSADFLDDHSNDVGFQVFPNPSHGQLNIEFEKEVQNTLVRIIDLHGKVLYNQTFDALEYLSLSLRDFKEGVYFIQIKYDTNSTILKHIVKL